MNWVLERLRQERTEDEAERLWRQCVHGRSLVAMIAEGVIGLCLIGGNSLEAELLALWVAPERSFHDVGQALLSRCFEQLLHSGRREIWRKSLRALSGSCRSFWNRFGFGNSLGGESNQWNEVAMALTQPEAI